MGTVVRVYLGCRILRLLRPLLGAGLVAGAILALHGGHLQLNSRGAKQLRNGAVAVSRDLPRALERALQRPHR
jgi:hypothetical protein